MKQQSICVWLVCVLSLLQTRQVISTPLIRRSTSASTTFAERLFSRSASICRDVSSKDSTSSETVFETVWVHILARWIHVNLLRDAIAGECNTVCPDVCKSTEEESQGSVPLCPSLENDSKCMCNDCSVENVVPAPTPPTNSTDPCQGTCGPSALQECLPAASNPSVFECSCTEGAAKSTTTGACVATCNTPSGNPCGPGVACKDDDALGHVCTPLYDTAICPAGCPPTETCTNGQCVCLPGHLRTQAYLPCVPV